MCITTSTLYIVMFVMIILYDCKIIIDIDMRRDVSFLHVNSI